MKFLDRGPQVGDLVEVTYRCTVTANDPESDGVTTVLPGYRLRTDLVDAADVRVVAPEPKAGDAVTADMDELPPGSVIAHGNIAALRMGFQQDGWRVTNSTATWYWQKSLPGKPSNGLLDLHWLIVRIGGAS